MCVHLYAIYQSWIWSRITLVLCNIWDLVVQKPLLKTSSIQDGIGFYVKPTSWKPVCATNFIDSTVYSHLNRVFLIYSSNEHWKGHSEITFWIPNFGEWNFPSGFTWRWRACKTSDIDCNFVFLYYHHLYLGIGIGSIFVFLFLCFQFYKVKVAIDWRAGKTSVIDCIFVLSQKNPTQ